MAKMILILDKMPDSCQECPIGLYSGGLTICCGTDDDGNRHSTWFPTNIPGYCPLKELPAHFPPFPKDSHPDDHDKGFIEGWNECLDQIIDGGI